MKRRIMLLATAVLATACGGASGATDSAGNPVVRLGIFPNLTHAPGFVALGQGLFDEALAPATIQTTVFNSGTDAGNALLAGSIDATYIGPGPAISLFVESEGRVAVVSGAVSGGASLVVRKGSGIDSPDDLRGKKVAVPGIGNTQDVALRAWLEENGLQSRDEGGDVLIVEVDNPELPGLFRAGELDAAWEPEPYPSLLVAEGLAEPYLNEAELWPDGRFVTTHLLVNTSFMDQHPELVRGLIEANVDAIELLNEDPAVAKATAQAQLIQAGAPSLDQAVVDVAWKNLTFTWDPIASSLQTDARNAFELGYLDQSPTNVLELYRLDVLNAILAERGEAAVEGAA